MNVNTLSFSSPILESKVADKEHFATLGRMAESIWDCKSRRKVAKIVYLDDKIVHVKLSKSKEQNCFAVIAKVIVCALFFPIVLGVKLTYRSLNNFNVVDITRSRTFSPRNSLKEKSPLLEQQIIDEDNPSLIDEDNPSLIELKELAALLDPLILEQLKPEESVIDRTFFPTSKNTKDLTLDDIFEKGMASFDQLNYFIAVKYFIIFHLRYAKLNHEFGPEIGPNLSHQEKYNQIMQKTITACRKLKNKDEIVLQTNEEIKEQFLLEVQEFLDYKLETNPTIVQAKLNAKNISLGKGVKLHAEQDIVFEMKNKKSEQAYVSATQGYRKEMEDKSLMSEFQINQNGKIVADVKLYAIFDGHAGVKTAKFAKDNLQKFLKEELDSKPSLDDLEIWNALKIAPVKMNDVWKKTDNDWSGTTACIALVIQQKQNNSQALWIANIGDSRAVICKNNQAEQLTIDAKPNSKQKSFDDSVYKRGGFISDGRVDSFLATARALGDRSLPGITARPEVAKVDLGKLDKNQRNFLIIACDGLWDVIDSEEAVKCGLENNLEDLSKILVDKALASGSRDNITVMVVQF